MALTKAVIVNLDAPGAPPIAVMFNPPRYDLSKANQFAEICIPGLPSSVLQFVSGMTQTLTIELFYDTTESGADVRTATAAITNLAEPAVPTRAPPRLLLLWGSLAFPCFLGSVQQQFDYFSAAGMPLRARLQCEFKGQESLQKMIAAVPAAPSDLFTTFVAKAGDSLQAIAASVYGDASKWREIADANGIDDPRAIAAGLKLQIPGLT
jgi:LysM repeat protein